MAKIYMKDIKRLCNCIQGLSYQHIKENEKAFALERKSKRKLKQGFALERKSK